MKPTCPRRKWRHLTFSIALILCSVTALLGYICAANTSSNVCAHFKTVLQEDMASQGKFSCDSAVLFLPAKNGSEAFMQAQNLCIKLGAVPGEKSDAAQTYLLSQDNGKLTLYKQSDDQTVYAILFLGVHCRDLKLKEVRYVSLKAYRDIKTK